MEITPNIHTLEETSSYGKFVVEPLERGYGVTLGNSLRRVLLSSIPGAAVTYVRIDKVLHEFSTIPGVKEDTTELLLNIKELAVKVDDISQNGKTEPKTIKISRSGEGRITGSDVECPSGVEVVNPELYLATISDTTAKLEIEMTVDVGRGYVLPERLERRAAQPIGSIPIGAAFTPVRKVNFNVESTRVQSNTNFERLVLEIWTNGAVMPGVALSKAAIILGDYFALFAEYTSTVSVRLYFDGEEPVALPSLDTGVYASRIEELDFSVRTYNCLKRASVLTVGDLVQYSENDLMQIRNFGRKSLAEVRVKLTALELTLKGGATIDLGDIDLESDTENE